MAKKKDKNPNQEIQLSTDDEVEQVSEEKFKETLAELEESAQILQGPVAESHGPLAPAGSDMAVALDHEGLGPPKLARKLRILLDSAEPKWNHKLKKWDYFVNAELWRRCIEMIMKVRGDYAPEKRINLKVDVGLEELLKLSAGMTPEEAKEKIKDYIDVEVEIPDGPDPRKA
jgi:hypothetical protein